MIIVAEGTFDVKLFGPMLTYYYAIDYLSKLLIKDSVSFEALNEVGPYDLEAFEVLVGEDGIDGYLLEVKLALANDRPFALELSVSHF